MKLNIFYYPTCGCGNSFTTTHKIGSDFDFSKLSRFRENSIKSFEEAFLTGNADFVEFDLSLTKDGIPVIYHDLAFLYKGKEDIVKNYTFQQLQNGRQPNTLYFY